MKSLFVLILVIFVIEPLYAVILTRNGPISGRRLSPKAVVMKKLEKQYPWLNSRDELNKECLRIAECFSNCPKDKDVWVEFKPLLKSFMEVHELVGDYYDCILRMSAVSEFCLYSFAGEDETELIKADFSGRRDCLSYICKFMYVFYPSEIEDLGVWLSTAKFLAEDEDTKKKDFLKAEKKDTEMIYRQVDNWVKKYIDKQSSGLKHLRPEWKKTENKFKFRSIYNKNLAEFRTFAFEIIRKSIITGYGEGTSAKREKIWAEFCVKANVTEEERKVAEKAVPSLKEEEKSSDKTKEIEVVIEI